MTEPAPRARPSPRRRAPTVAPAPGAAGRNAEVDFWRGLILLTIFINHLPDTVFGRLTHRNLGLSDSAEAFVFLAGIGVAGAHARLVAKGGGFRDAVRKFWRRAAKLYAVHLLLSATALVIFAINYAYTENFDFFAENGRDLFLSDPGAGVVGTLLLGHQLGFFDILPLYVVLMLAAPVFAWLASRRPALALAASVATYAVARLTDLHVPTWPVPGAWYFNVFAWQILFGLGMLAGFGAFASLGAWRAPLVAASALVLAAGLLVATNAFGAWPELQAEFVRRADGSKTDLGLARLLHFLALAIVIRASGVGVYLLRLPGAEVLTLLGRHPLPVFAVGSIISALGQVLNAALPESNLLDVVFIPLGAAALVLLATTLEWSQRSRRPPRP